MKLLTLITTFIITLASSNVFAKTFVCENWREGSVFQGDGKVFNGTMFIGQKKGDIITVKLRDKTQADLILLGKSNNDKFLNQEFYALKHYYDLNQVHGIFGFMFKNVDTYDFVIANHSSIGVMDHTFCNWQ